jgi:hypothetical protein
MASSSLFYREHLSANKVMKSRPASGVSTSPYLLLTLRPVRRFTGLMIRSRSARVRYVPCDVFRHIRDNYHTQHLLSKMIYPL